MNRKHKNLLFSTFLLVFVFLLCRFTFFETHGMKQFPFILFLFGLGMLFISTLCNFQIVFMLSAPGYIISFVPAIIFGEKYADPTGAMILNNTWIIWTGAYISIILIGIVAEVLRRYRRRQKS